MKIIRSVKQELDKEAEAECFKCRCQFSFQAKEAKFQSDQRDGNAYVIDCPECKSQVWVSVMLFK